MRCNFNPDPYKNYSTADEVRRLIKAGIIKFSDDIMGKCYQVFHRILQLKDHKKCQEPGALPKIKNSMSEVTLEKCPVPGCDRWCLCCKIPFNLGVLFAKGSIAAAQLEIMLTTVLEMFGLAWNDVDAVSMDGCAVNVKFGKEKLAIMQLCLAHGIHLAVTKVLYKKVPKASSLKVITLGDDPESDDETDSRCQKITRDFYSEMKQSMKIMKLVSCMFHFWM